MHSISPLASRVVSVAVLGCTLLGALVSAAAEPPVLKVEGQPLAAQVKRVLDGLEMLGTPLPAEARKELQPALEAKDVTRIQKILDQHVLFVVGRSLGGEGRRQRHRDQEQQRGDPACRIEGSSAAIGACDRK